MEIPQDSNIASKPISYFEFKALVEKQAALFRQEDGRFYVMLSLLEAEHMRSVMHMRRGMDLTSLIAGSDIIESKSEEKSSVMVKSNAAINETKATMWTLGDNDAVMVGTTGKNITAAHRNQHSAMVNTYRFLNSDVFFDDESLMTLLKVMNPNSCETRELWWSDVRACRRRLQLPWDGAMPISTLFTTNDEYQFLEYKSVVERMRGAMQERGMLVFDAFRAFNSSHTGLLSCSELYGALEWLNLRFTPNQVYDFVRRVAVDNEGLISYADFKRVFRLSDDDFESHNATNHSFGTINPKVIPEIADASKKVGARLVT